ncbi:MAG: hypothetical protein HYY01_02820 [Chloroflexi bacterium]|nr:hypothetical protein [Chloroflexota bacterium]
MSDLQFFQEGQYTYCYVGRKKCRLVEAAGIRFLVPIRIIENELLFQQAVRLLAEQAKLFQDMLRQGVPIEDAVKVLALGSLVTFEFSTDSVGNMLATPAEDTDS